MQCIPSSSLMNTVVEEEGIDIVGPLGVMVSRLTVNLWSNSRLSSFSIPNVVQEVSLTASPLMKITCRGDGSEKSSPNTTTLDENDSSYYIKVYRYGKSAYLHRL